MRCGNNFINTGENSQIITAKKRLFSSQSEFDVHFFESSVICEYETMIDKTAQLWERRGQK